MRRIIVLSAAALLLAACQPEAPGGGEAQPPADAPAATSTPAIATGPFAAPFSARGNEPFWRIDVNGTNIALTRPDAPIAVAMNAGLAATDAQAIWTARSGDAPVTVTLTKGDCSDGMSDLKYGYTAEVVWGEETLNGCGFPTAEEPKEGQ